MGSKITKLQPVGGFAAETGGAIALLHRDAARRAGQHHAHDHRRHHRRRRDPAAVGGALGRRRPDRLGLGADDSRRGRRSPRSTYWLLSRRRSRRKLDVSRVRPAASRQRCQRSAQAGSSIVNDRAALAAGSRRDLAAVQLDQVLDDRQAQAGAARIARAARSRLVDAIEALEDARQIRVGNARALRRRRSARCDRRVRVAPRHDRAASGA